MQASLVAIGSISLRSYYCMVLLLA